MDIILIYFAIKYAGDWNKIYDALENKEKPIFSDLKILEDKIKKTNIKIVTIIDQDYPNELKKAYKPPFVIWVKGDLNRLKNKILCITGNSVDEITNKRINASISNLNNKYEILSPGFKGVDKIIESFVERPLIKVAAQGINFSEQDHHLHISEFPPQIDHPKREYFKQRNRIIAALSDQLVLFSSEADGGMNHLVSAFLNLGKEISCFPGDGNANDGNSELIKQGANLITNIQEIC